MDTRFHGYAPFGIDLHLALSSLMPSEMSYVNEVLLERCGLVLSRRQDRFIIHKPGANPVSLGELHGRENLRRVWMDVSHVADVMAKKEPPPWIKAQHPKAVEHLRPITDKPDYTRALVVFACRANAMFYLPPGFLQGDGHLGLIAQTSCVSHWMYVQTLPVPAFDAPDLTTANREP